MKLSSEKAELPKEIKELLGKELCFGMTDYVCRFGSLGDGFEKLTKSQRYYQAIKEVWVRAIEIQRLRANSKRLQADLIEARDELEHSNTDHERLRAESKIDHAELGLFEALVSLEDTQRQMEAFNRVRLELQDDVRSQYPDGIEQAERDNWETVAKYRLMKSKTPGWGSQDLAAIPMDFETKARIGILAERTDMIAPLALTDEKKLKKMEPEARRALDLAERNLRMLKDGA